MRSIYMVILMLLVSGCHLPAQMVWSPDGKLAAYRVGDQARVIDESGKTLFGPVESLGGFAWSADSKTLYLASKQKIAQRPQFELIDRTPEPSTRPIEATGVDTMVISSWQADGASTPLFTLPDDKPVWHMALSPDQQWLTVIQQHSNDTMSLSAFHQSSRKLLVISRSAGMPACFTGPNRMVFVETDHPQDDLEHHTGQIVEITLNEMSGQLERKPLLFALPDRTIWMQCIGDNLLFTAIPRSFPSRVAQNDDKVCKLYHFSRADGGLAAIADDVGPLFMVSPDCKQILIEKLGTEADKIIKRELALIKPNGSDGRVLRDITNTPDLPLWPSWKSSNEIVFTPPIAPAQPMVADAQGCVRFEAVVYKLTESFELQTEKCLSQGWNPELKPCYKVQPAPSTAPVNGKSD